MPLSALLSRYDQLIIDLDGCLWLGEEAVPGSVEAVEALRSAGKRLAFATNDSRHTTEELVAKLWRLGIQAAVADVVTAGGAMQHLLADTRSGKTAMVIGTEAMRRHVAEAGLRILNGTDLASRAEVVVVGGTDRLTYDDLKEATLAVRRGADLLGAARDPTYPQPDGMWPGTGAILASIEYASGRRAAIVGKPEPQLFLTALDRLGGGRTLVVGDRLDSDVEAAARAKLDAALVLTGGASEGDASRTAGPKPVAVVESLARLVEA